MWNTFGADNAPWLAGDDLGPVRATVDDADPLAWPRAAGRMAGLEWGRDPKAALEQGERCAVRLVMPQRITMMRGRPSDNVAAWFMLEEWPEKPTVYVNLLQDAHQQKVSMAHELAHMGHANWTEDQCEAYARAFMGA